MVVRFIVFLTSATLICRGTDISKCFREFLGIRDNKSRLHVNSKGKGKPKHPIKLTTTITVHLQTYGPLESTNSEHIALMRQELAGWFKPGPEVVKRFSCSIQLIVKLSPLINMKMPPTAEKFSCSAMFSKKEFANVRNLRSVWRTKGVSIRPCFSKWDTMGNVSAKWRLLLRGRKRQRKP